MIMMTNSITQNTLVYKGVLVGLIKTESGYMLWDIIRDIPYEDETKLCCDCKKPLEDGFVTRCVSCYDLIYLPK